MKTIALRVREATYKDLCRRVEATGAKSVSAYIRALLRDDGVKDATKVRAKRWAQSATRRTA